MKSCSICFIEKPLSEFNNDKSRKDGKRYYCRCCQKIKTNLYDKDNVENKKQQYKLLANEIKITRKNYYNENKTTVIKRTSSYKKRRLQRDSFFRLITNLRSRPNKLLRSEKSIKFFKYIGCNRQTLKTHLESQFTQGMNWENYGQWHVDHIIPLALATDDNHLFELCHYTNLQPLWAKDNIRKGARYV